jgi:hypothetical protein
MQVTQGEKKRAHQAVSGGLRMVEPEPTTLEIATERLIARSGVAFCFAKRWVTQLQIP